MSGKPYEAGVTRVAELLSLGEKLRDEIDVLKPKAERYKSAIEEHNRCSEELEKLLKEMDIEAPGNWGFGGRMGWFLTKMREEIWKQFRQD